MKALLLRTALVSALFAGGAFAADDTTTSARMKEILKAQLAADAKSQPVKLTPPPSATAAAKPETPAAPADPAPASTSTKKDAVPAAAKAAKEPATVLPKVEVKKDRITVLDHEIQEQEKDIAREKKNTKPSELDTALNGAKASKALSILGGNSDQNRASIAKERVSLMESERDILEAMKLAKTKEEKKELQTQLDELRAYRRSLEKNLR